MGGFTGFSKFGDQVKNFFGVAGPESGDVTNQFNESIGPGINKSFDGAIARLLQFQKGGKDPLLNQNMNELFDPAIRGLDRLRGSLDPLEGDLRRGALASTQGAALAATQGARAAAGGRGGLAFGGGAGAIGARASQQAAVGQSAALANSLVQARTARASFETDLAGRRAEAGSALVGALGSQQAVQEQRNSSLAALLQGKASAYSSGLTGTQSLGLQADLSQQDRIRNMHKFSVMGFSAG